MGFRCVDEQSPANSCLSTLSLFSELGKLSPVYKLNILREFMRVFCGMSLVRSSFSLLSEPVSVADVLTNHKSCTWGGNSAATVGVNVAKCMHPGSLETSQKMTAVHVTLSAYLNKSQNDVLQCTLTEREEQKNRTSSQTIANTICGVKENSVTEVQEEKALVDCDFLGSLPEWSILADVRHETAEGRVQNRDNGTTRRRSYTKEHLTGDSLFMPSSGAVVSELQLLSDRSSLTPTEDNEEFGVSTTEEMWTFEDIFASGEEFLPLHRPMVQKTTYHVSDKSQGSADEKLLNTCNSNGVLSPDYGFWEGDDIVGLLAQTTSSNDKFCNVLDDHCNPLARAHFSKSAEGNQEYKETEVVEKLCELLAAHISDSKRKDTDNCSDTTTSIVTMLPNITKSDQAINKCAKHEKTEQKEEGKVAFPTDSQFQLISPEHVLLDDTECLRKAPQRVDEEKEILDCPLNITDSKLSLSSEKGEGEEEEGGEEEEDDDDSSSESSSVATVVLNPLWVPENTDGFPVGNQSQQTSRGGKVYEDGSVSQRINDPMTDSEGNCDKNERTGTVHHSLGSDQSCSGPQSGAESVDRNEPLMQCFDDLMRTTVPSTEFANSVPLLINPSGTCSVLDQKLVKDSDTLLVKTDRHRTVQTDPQCSGGMRQDCKHSGSLDSVQKLKVISKQQIPSSCITKEATSNLSPSNLIAVSESKRQACHHKTNTVADKILHRTKKKMLYIHRTSLGQTLLPIKQPEKLSGSSLAEESLQSNPVAHELTNIEQAEQCTSKRKRKCVSESVELWLQNNIKAFPGMQSKQVFEEISKDAACDLPKDTDNASRVGPASVSPRKHSSVDRRSDEKTGFDSVQTDAHSFPGSTETSANPYKRCNSNEGLVTVQTHLTRQCSVKKTSKEGNGVKLSCQYCGKLFYRPSKLKDHIGTHTLPFHCLRCGRRFATESQLVTHEKLLSCSPHEKCRYKCEGCDQKFLQRVCLLKHVEKHLKQDKEKGVEKSRCKVCGKVFDQEKLLLLHKEVHVAKGRLHTCEVCGKTFERQAALARHRRLHLECSYCGEYFIGKDPLRTHIRQHLKDEKEKALKQKRATGREENEARDEVTGTFPIVERELSLLICPDCGKIFRWKMALQRHLAEHKREDRKKAAARFLCDDCGATFTSKVSLHSHTRQHMRAKTSSSSVKVRWPRQPPEPTSTEDAAPPSTSIVLQFSCEKCHTDFPQLSELQHHTCGSDDRKQYMCNICDKAFVSPNYLSRHKRLHFPPHECRYCGHTFARRYEWRYHEWRHEKLGT